MTRDQHGRLVAFVDDACDRLDLDDEGLRAMVFRESVERLVEFEPDREAQVLGYVNAAARRVARAARGGSS